MPRSHVPNHHPECEAWRIDEIAVEQGRELPSDICGDVEIMRCHDDCLSLAAAVERGHELAEQHGW